jgi:hypothetical protein
VPGSRHGELIEKTLTEAAREKGYLDALMPAKGGF